MIPCNHFPKHHYFETWLSELIIIKTEIPIWHSMCTKNKYLICQRKPMYEYILLTHTFLKRISQPYKGL